MPLSDPEARRAYARNYQRENLREITEKKKLRRIEQRAFIIAAKSKPCADCGVEYPWWVMEFDHVRGEKRQVVSHFARSVAAWETITAEIAKCEVVCSNCHANRTHQRRVGSDS